MSCSDESKVCFELDGMDARYNFCSNGLYTEAKCYGNKYCHMNGPGDIKCGLQRNKEAVQPKELIENQARINFRDLYKYIGIPGAPKPVGTTVSELPLSSYQAVLVSATSEGPYSTGAYAGTSNGYGNSNNNDNGYSNGYGNDYSNGNGNGNSYGYGYDNKNDGSGGAYTQNVQKPVGGAYRYNGEITADPDIYAPVNVNPGVTGQPGINPIPTQGIGIPGGPGYNAGVGVGVGAGAGAGNYDAKGYYINENYANQVPPSVPSSTTSDFYFVKIKYIFAVGGFGDNEGDLDPDFKPLIDAQKSALNMYSSVLTAIPTLPPLPPPPKLGAYINKNPGFPGDNSANGGGNVNYNNMVY